MADDLELRFGADASGLVEGSDVAAGSVKALQTEVGELAGEMKLLEAATEAEAVSLKEMAASIGEAAAQIGEAKEAVMHLGEALLAAFAVEAIVEWTEKIAEAGEHAEQLGVRLGMTTAEVEAWQAVALQTGRSSDQFAMAMTRLADNAIKAAGGSKVQAAAMKDLGLSTQEATNPQQLMLDLADRFANMHEAGETGREIADAMALMGRSGADMIPVLNRGSEGLQDLMAKGGEFGAVLSDVANEKVAGAAQQINEFKLRMDGLSKQTFVQVIPQIEAIANGLGQFVTMVEQAIQPASQFRQILSDVTTAAITLGSALTTYVVGGMVATAAKTFLASEAVEAFVARMAFAGLVAEVGGTMAGLSVAMGVFTEAVAAATAGIVELTVAMLANPLTWIAIGVGAAVLAFQMLTRESKTLADAQRDLKEATETAEAATADLTAKTQAQLDKIEDQLTDLRQLQLAHLAAAQAALAHSQAEYALADAQAHQQNGFAANSAAQAKAAQAKQDLVDTTAQLKIQTAAVVELNEAVEKVRSQAPANPSLGALGQAKPQKGAAGESELQQWEAELQDKKLAENNFWNDDLAGERAFWEQKLAVLQAETGGTKAEENQRAAEIRTIRTKIFTDSKTLANQERSESLGTLTEEVKAQIDAENAKYQAVKDGLNARIQAVQQAAKRGEIDPATELAQLVTLNDQMVANERQKSDAIYQINLQALQQKEALYALDGVNLAKIQGQEVSLAAQHQQQLTTITAKGAMDRSKLEQQAATQNETLWKTRVGPVVQSFGAGLQGMINGTETFRSAISNVFMGIEASAFKSVEGMVTNWIAGEISKTTISQGQSALRQAVVAIESLFGITQQHIVAPAEVEANAAVAASAAYASTAAIPIVGPELAPAAAAAAFGGAMAWAPAAMAAGGYDIPSGVNPIVQTHQEEMILPAKLANPLRTVLGNMGAAGGGSGGGGGGNTTNHKHNWNVSAVDASSFKNMLEQNPDALTNVMQRQFRNMRLA